MRLLFHSHRRQGDVFWPLVILLIIAIVGWGSYLRLFSEEAAITRLVEARAEIGRVDAVLDEVESIYLKRGQTTSSEAPDLVALQAQERRLERARTSLRNVRSRDEQVNKVKKDLQGSQAAGREMLKALIEAADGTGGMSFKQVVLSGSWKEQRAAFNQGLVKASQSARALEDPRVRKAFG